VTITLPVFARSFHVEVLDPEGVFLFSERGSLVLRGMFHCRLAALLDGAHRTDDIVSKLAHTASAEEVYYALGLLEQRGYIVEADGPAPRDRTTFWHALGINEDAAERRLRQVKVSLSGCGQVHLPPFAAALAALDVQVAEDGGFAVVLTDDYLQKGLDEVNVAALTSCTPWLIVKPVGTVLWIGPVFRPGASACWECLADRLRANRKVDSYVQRRLAISIPFPTSRAALPATVQAALGLAAAETAKAVAGGDELGLNDHLITLDVLTLETQKHQVVRRPQCPRCGDPEFARDRGLVPLRFRTARKRFTADGGHRTVSPERTYAKYAHHISPITGAVSGLSRIDLDEEGSLCAYVAGNGMATSGNDLRALRQGLLSRSGGKGITDAQARVSALCEALERHSGSFRGDEVSRRATYRGLGAEACHPNACMLISDEQYERRHEWNAATSRFHRIPDPFDEAVELDWTPMWSLTEQEARYLPTSYCYYGYSSASGVSFCRADSNGCAAGNTLEEAVLQGFLELIERDGVCLWWYNRVRLPGVDLDSFAEPYVDAMRRFYHSVGREIWALDLMSDLGVPTFAAVSRRTDGLREEIILGFGSHLDARIALLRALTELNQYSGLLTAGPDEKGNYPYADASRGAWWKTATIANQPYLRPSESRPRTRTDYAPEWSEDVHADIQHCQRIVERQGMEVLVLDQTRADIGLPVVRVVVPGLRHHWARLAPGRLYDVPVKLGWLDAPLAEDQLNPVPMFV
jgi:oxazoline/thiazoline synthase